MNNIDLHAMGAWAFPRPPRRYGGTGLSWDLQRLATADKEAVSVLYENIASLMKLSAWSEPEPNVRKEALIKWQKVVNWRRCWRDMAALGPDTYAQFGSSLELRQVIHDLRGGPLTSLVLALSALEHESSVESDFDFIRLMARDVRKIARNCFPDLDPLSYEQDQMDVGHAIELVVEKWSKVYRRGGIKVVSEFVGNIAQSCVEFSALDRVLYNLMNNAIRAASHSTEPVYLRIFTNPNTSDNDVARFYISNPINTGQAQQLNDAFGDDLTDLFVTNYSTTGSGLGMQIASSFVGKAFGVSTRRALESGIIGARVTEQTFHVWFHWPVAD